MQSHADIGRVTMRVLADAAFVLCEAAHGGAFAGEVLEASMTFSGPASGRFVLAGGAEVCATLAANLLGLEAGDPAAAASAGDALCETCNMLAGAWMEAWYGAVPYGLGVPTLARVPAAETAARWPGPLWRLALTTDEGHRLEALALPFAPGGTS